MNVFDRLGRDVADEQDALRKRSTHRPLVRERLQVLDAPRRNKKRALARASLAAAVLAAGLAVGLVRFSRRAEVLTAFVGAANERATVGAWLEAPERDTLPLHFSDGTQIDMAPGARARLVDIGPAGAHLLLEKGGAHVSVVRKAHAAWQLSVGPFAVRVTGTRFDVRWDPDRDLFELDLEDGHVEISGCTFGDAYHLSAGERARASCKRASFEILDHSGEPETAPPLEGRDATASAPAPGPSPDLPDRPRRIEPGRGPTSASPGGWRELAERGQYAAAFAAASDAGFEAQCAGANADELALLGDAARFSGNPAKAIHALQLLRRRFPGTPRASTAAFTLGRLEFDGTGSYAKAAGWFRTYLREQPGGPLAREARGRLMEALHRAGDDRAAREVAAQYLRDYPSGPHAALAQDIRGATDP